MSPAPRRILVTGGAGLVGSAVVDELVAADYERILVLDTTEPPKSAAAWCRADVLSAADVSGAAEAMDAIVHLAALPRPVGYSTEDIMRVNLMGTLHVYQAAAEHSVSRVVLLSSTAVIGTDWARGHVLPQYLPIDEDHPCLPRDPYGLSKVMCEEVAAYAWRTFGVASVVLRPPWVASRADLEELAGNGGRAVDGVHHYSYVDVRDLARAIRLSLTAGDEGVTTLFIAADDSTLADPLSEVIGGLTAQPIPGTRTLRGTRGGITPRRAESVLGWRAEHGWRSLGRPRPDARSSLNDRS